MKATSQPETDSRPDAESPDDDARGHCGWYASSQDLRRGLHVEEIPFVALASVWSAAFGGPSQPGRAPG